MLIDKEYPATHSMYTSWFAVDDEGCVALIEIEDDGPVPYGDENDEYPDELVQRYWVDKEGKKLHNLKFESSCYHVDEFPDGFPSFAYHVYEGGSENGAYREISPEHPLKVSDFGTLEIAKAWHIPGSFKDKPMLQLLRYFPCKTHYSGIIYEGREYVRMKDEDGVFKYFCLKEPNNTISEELMAFLINEGKAEEYDFMKHQDL